MTETKNTYKDNDFINLSFGDSDILDMQFDSESKTLKLYLDGAYWHLEPKKVLDKGFLLFSNWQSITNEYWDGNNWIPCQNLKGEPLKDLLIFKYSDEAVVLESWAKNIPGWIRWKMMKPNCYGQFVDSDIECWF
jgi:hypothetical protein